MDPNPSRARFFGGRRGTLATRGLFLLAGMVFRRHAKNEGPSWTQERPRWPKRPRMVPRCPQDGPKYPKMAPRCLQDVPKMAQDAQDAPKMLPRWPQDGSKMLQDAPKITLRCTKDSLRYLFLSFSFRVGGDTVWACRFFA